MSNPEHSTKPKLLFLTSSFAMGGPQKSLIGLLQRLAPSNRYDLTVAILDPTKDDLRKFIPCGVTVIDVHPFVTALTLPKGRLVASIREIFRHLGIRSTLAASWGIMRNISNKSKTATVVRQSLWVAAMRQGKRSARLPGTYDVAIGILGMSTYAAVDLVEAHKKFHWVRSDTRILNRDSTIEDRFFSRIDGALAVSQATADLFVARYPYMEGSVRVYKNDIPNLKPMPDPPSMIVDERPIILTTTRLDGLKGIELAIDAAHHLKTWGVEFQWVILGDGPMRSSLLQQVNHLELSTQVRLMGQVMDVQSWLKRASVYVHPSRTEGRSNAVEEAKAASLPIVATRYPTVNSQINHGQSGLVCDLSGLAIAESVVSVLNSTSLQQHLAHHARLEYLQEAGDPHALMNWMLCEQ